MAAVVLGELLFESFVALQADVIIKQPSSTELKSFELLARSMPCAEGCCTQLPAMGRWASQAATPLRLVVARDRSSSRLLLLNTRP